MSKRLPTRISTEERANSSSPDSPYRPTTSRVSMSRVVVLWLASTRSYTCSMYRDGTRPSMFITQLKAARLLNHQRRHGVACRKGIGGIALPALVRVPVARDDNNLRHEKFPAVTAWPQTCVSFVGDGHCTARSESLCNVPEAAVTPGVSAAGRGLWPAYRRGCRARAG